MNSATLSDAQSRRRLLVRQLLYLLGVAAPTAALTVLAFGTARGVVRIDEFHYNTAQLVVNNGWWSAAYLLALPVFLIARESPLLAAAGVLIASVPQCVSAHIIVGRFVEAGWGDGLEGLAYVWAAMMTLVFVVAAVLGVFVTRRARSHPATQAA
jgi:hypothetical protein